MSSFFVNFNLTKDEFKDGKLHSQFSKPIRLRGDWEVGVYACHMLDEEGIFWVLSDIVDFSYVNEVPVQVMDIVDVSDMKNGKAMYMKVLKKQFGP